MFKNIFKSAYDEKNAMKILTAKNIMVLLRNACI